jgi:hypothetical protein
MSGCPACHRTGPWGLAGLVVLAVFLGACSSPSTLQRHTLPRAPTVDGSLDEWGGSLSYVGEKPVSLSVAPTDSLLFVAVALQDRDLVRSVAKNGLRVWIAPSGAQQRTYGIHYPLGLRKQRAPRSASQPTAAAPPSRPLSIQDVSLSELDIIRGEAHRRVPARHSSGLRANVSLSQGALIYELAIPVGGASGASESYGLRQKLRGPIGVGLDTPDPEDEAMQRPARPSSGIPSVTGTSRRGRSPRAGRRQSASSQQRPDLPTLDVWTTVVPASGE